MQCSICAGDVHVVHMERRQGAQRECAAVRVRYPRDSPLDLGRVQLRSTRMCVTNGPNAFTQLVETHALKAGLIGECRIPSCTDLDSYSPDVLQIDPDFHLPYGGVQIGFPQRLAAIAEPREQHALVIELPGHRPTECLPEG